MLENIANIDGIRLSAINVGIKQKNRPDLCLIETQAGSSCAAVFTLNRFAAAPVQIAKKHLGLNAAARYLLVNSGNANCGTGEVGIEDAENLCARVAELAGVDGASVLPFSTGVIGERLPVEKMAAGLEELYNNLSSQAWSECASAIMTTDTRPKLVSVQFECGDQTCSITGIAKGAGMIKPNMATMLSYIATDAEVEQASLQAALQQAVNASFNRITIDGDTSTNDSVVLFATGARMNTALHPGHPDWQTFEAALREVCTTLAKACVADGEGATKFVEVRVTSPSLSMSETIGFTVAESPLVKTALFASDPNWGRILAAIGRAPVEPFEISDVAIYLGDYQIVKDGSIVADYDESKAAAVMAQQEIDIVIRIGNGKEQCSIWTSDLSYDYVKINAEYRT